MDCPQKCTYDNLVTKASSNAYTLQDLLYDMNDLFIKIYGHYSRTSATYNDAADLEGYLTALISTEKGKIKELRVEKPKEPPTIKEEPLGNSQQISKISQQQLLRKKTVTPKPDTKSITIMDKRILGQNIKKLPTECLAEICKIVFETLETRE